MLFLDCYPRQLVSMGTKGDFYARLGRRYLVALEKTQFIVHMKTQILPSTMHYTYILLMTILASNNNYIIHVGFQSCRLKRTSHGYISFSL